MLLLSTKTNNTIVRTDELTDGQVVCKIVFFTTFNVSFWSSKEPSHREDSFEQGLSLASAIGHSPKIVPDVREFAVQFGQFVRDDFRKCTLYGYAQ